MKNKIATIREKIDELELQLQLPEVVSDQKKLKTRMCHKICFDQNCHNHHNYFSFSFVEPFFTSAKD